MYDDIGDLLVFTSEEKVLEIDKAEKNRIIRFGDQEIGEFIKNLEGMVLVSDPQRIFIGFKIIVVYDAVEENDLDIEKRLKGEAEDLNPIVEVEDEKSKKSTKKSKKGKKGRKTKKQKREEKEKQAKLIAKEEKNYENQIEELVKKPVNEVIYWGYWDIANRKNKLKSSKKEFSIVLRKAPMLKIPFDLSKLEPVKKKERVTLFFNAHRVIYETASLPLIARERLKAKPPKTKQKNVKQDKFDKSFYEPFIKNYRPNWDNRLFDKGSGIDVYIDGCRFLPDNVTVTKIIVRVVDPYFNKFVEPQAGLPELDTDILNPTFNYRDELRYPYFDPTLMLHITFVTFDSRTASEEPEIMGFSMFNLFWNRIESRQPLQRSEMPNSVLHTGYYQLPIYCQKIDEDHRPFYVEDLKKLDKLPGSSVLIRIRLAPVKDNTNLVLGLRNYKSKDQRIKKGVWIPPPLYTTGAYNNKLCHVRQTEEELIATRVDRDPIEARINSFQMMSMLGVNNDIFTQQEIKTMTEITEKNQLEDDLDQTDVDKEKDDKIIDFLDDKLILKDDSPFLNLKYFSKYRSVGGGFKFSLDGLYNMPNDFYYFAVSSFNPPGAYYQPKSDSSDLRFNTFYDWEKTSKSTVYFTESYVKFGNKPLDITLSMIVDVKKFRFRDVGPPDIKNVAWTCIPIFTPDGYVNSNIAQYPLFKGEPTAEILQELKIPDCWRVVQRLLQERKISYFKSASLFTRVLDMQREVSPSINQFFLEKN